MNCSLSIYNFDPTTNVEYKVVEADKATDFTMIGNNQVVHYGHYPCRESMTYRLNEFILMQKRERSKLYSEINFVNLKDKTIPFYWIEIYISPVLTAKHCNKLSKFFSSLFNKEILFLESDRILIKINSMSDYFNLFIPSFLVWYINIMGNENIDDTIQTTANRINFLVSVYKNSPLHAYFLWIHYNYSNYYLQYATEISNKRFNGPANFTLTILLSNMDILSTFFNFTGIDPNTIKKQNIPIPLKKYIVYETEYLKNHPEGFNLNG